VLFVDLNSVGVSSVAMPCSEPAAEPAQTDGADMQAAEAVHGQVESNAEAVQLQATLAEDADAVDEVVPGTAAAAADKADAVNCEVAQAAAATAGAVAAEGSQAHEELPSTAVQAAAAAADQQQLYSPGLQEFSQLCTLDLSDNRLSCIAGLAWLPALQQLLLSANRLQGLHGLAQVLGGSSSSCTDSHNPAAQDAAAAAAAAEQQLQEQQEEQGQGAEEVAAGAALLCSTVARQLSCPGGLSCLQLLDVSFNMIPAEHLLGTSSPLAHLPR
jgi:hypothetical protein